MYNFETRVIGILLEEDGDRRVILACFACKWKHFMSIMHLIETTLGKIMLHTLIKCYEENVIYNFVIIPGF
jgi:hypothetical protein